MVYSKKKVGYFDRIAVKDWNSFCAFEEYQANYSLPTSELLKIMKDDLSSMGTKVNQRSTHTMTKELEHLVKIVDQQQQHEQKQATTARKISSQQQRSTRSAPTTSTPTTGKLADSIHNIRNATQNNYTTILENRREDNDKNVEHMAEIKAGKRKDHQDHQESETGDQSTQASIFLKKSKKSFSVHAPNPTPSISTNKPRINNNDVQQLKPLYSINICDTKKNPAFFSPAEHEYKENMDDQAANKCLKESPRIFKFITEAIDQPFIKFLDFLWTYKDDTFSDDDEQMLKLIKYIATDFHANCLKPPVTTQTNERTPFCEHVLPIFKYFSAVTGLISFIWCEKASPSIKQLMVYQPESALKLFDGIGTSVKDKVERILIECSGDVDGDHTEEDSLKLLDCTSKCLQLEMMNYRLASIETFKKRRIITIQSIGNKITMTATGLGDGIYYYIEQRSTIVPRDWGDRLYWIKVIELLLKLKELLLEQEAITEQLKKEQVGRVLVDQGKTIKSLAILND